MTPTQARHLRTLIADQVDAELHYEVAQIKGGDQGDAYNERTLAARRVTEYIDELTT